MNDAELAALLEWCAPRLGLRWRGFSNVRGQVCKRIARRIRELELTDLAAYRALLDSDPAEWAALERLCVVTLSRFYRDAAVWQALEREVLPQLAVAAQTAAAQAVAAQTTPHAALRCWSVGCASGEEPYTLAIVWGLALAQRYPALELRVLATDRHEPVLARAARARYQQGTLQELPVHWRELAFQSEAGELLLRERFRRSVELHAADGGSWLPTQTFQLILCRNVVFTYFDEQRQRDVLRRLLTCLAPGGAFLIAPRERLPENEQLEPWLPEQGIFRKRPAPLR
ncbi:MAG: CheR methyltransferase, binding domain [Pseudomonadota bacterium]